MLWALFLHFYQPPNQTPEILSSVVSESYRPILRILERNPQGKITVNVDGCLIDQLLENGFGDVISDLTGLIKKGQVELTSSVKYHAFLPLIPEVEIKRRVQDSLFTRQQIFGQNWQPQGFFPPELAVNSRIVRAAKRMGFSYILADEISLSGNISQTDHRNLYEDQGVKIFFADRQVSDLLRADRQLTFGKLSNLIKDHNLDYLVSANDAEIFGHHYPEREEILAKIFREQGRHWMMVTLSELLEKVKEVKKIKVRKGSWETSPEDLKAGLPFPLWHDPGNLIQKLYWQLAWFVIGVFGRVPQREKDDPGMIWHSARRHLNRGLASCYLFWASCRPWWNPDMIVAGATELVKVTRTLREVNIRERQRAEELYVTIIKTAWDWHWSGEAQKRIDKFELTKGKREG